MDVQRLRAQIPGCQTTTYLNTGWSGPSPEQVVEAIKKRLEYESYEGPTSQPVMDSGNALKLRARESVARLLNVSAAEILLTQNTTEGLNLVMSGFPWEEGDEIVTFDIEHPSVMTPCLYAQHRSGARVVTVPLATNDDWDTVLSKVEGVLTPRTRMVFFSHIQFSCGLRIPLEGIRKLTRDRGIYMLVDGAQTPGHISLDLASSGVDFYAIPAHKWLLGPDGAGALFIRNDLIERIRPSYVGYHAAGPGAGPQQFVFTDVEQFVVSTTSAPLAAGFLEAIQFMSEIGIQEVEARNVELSGFLKARLLELPGFSILSPLEGPGVCGLTSFRIEGVQPEDAVRHLWEEQRIVARSVARPSAIRVSSHLFNTEEELENLVGALRRMKA